MRHSDGQPRYRVAGWVWFTLVSLLIVVISCYLISHGSAK